MPVIIDNFQWMGWNTLLALLPIFFGYLVIRYWGNLIGSLSFVFWLLFFPNTIYLVTDLQYLPEQLSKFNISFDLVLLVQYLTLVLIGIFSYVFTLKFMLKKFKILEILIFPFNFLVAFAVSLGKIQRTESWDAIIHPIKVVADINRSLMSPQTIVFVVIFGIFINFIWFSCREKLKDLPSLP